MKLILQNSVRGLLALVLVWSAAGVALAQQNDKKDGQIKLSSGENDLVKKIQAEKTLAKQFEVAQKLIEKYPKSQVRPRFAEHLLNSIGELKNPEEKISGIETFLSVFTEASEQDMAVPILLEAYIAAQRWDDAFGLAENAFKKDPTNSPVMAQLAINGANMANAGKKDYLDQSTQYAIQAIELVESDKRPANATDAYWVSFKKDELPRLYQALGMLQKSAGGKSKAKATLQKAATLAPADPINYFLLGLMVEEDYQAQAKLYNIMPAGPDKEAKLKTVNVTMDELIDLFAHFVALSEGQPQLQGLRPQVLKSLQDYYKYRKGSLDGLDALLAKYKK